VLGTGVAILLILLSAWFSPSMSATATSVMSNDQAQVWNTVPQRGGDTRPVSGFARGSFCPSLAS
jgi:hypothetical protein